MLLILFLYHEGFILFLELLIEHGASVNVANSSGYTPLHVAMQVSWSE